MMGEMNHSEVRELLEDAAIEPGGLERLMAGDAPNAALVAGHLTGCPECTDELERLRRSVGVIRPAVRLVPPPELRQRTLDYVAAVGRPRGRARSEAALGSEAALASPTPLPAGTRRGPTRLQSLAALAAALILAVTGTTVAVNSNRDEQSRRQAAEIEALGDVARWTLRVDGQGDAHRVALASANGGSTTGTLVFSPSSTELVVVANALELPLAGHEYRCWLDVGGQRSQIGKMFFGGDLAYWVGRVPKVTGLLTGARFGVSLVDLSAGGPGQPILVSGS
jgi:hypothetical protein